MDPQEKESKENLDRLGQRSDRILSWFYQSRFIVSIRLDFKFSFIYLNLLCCPLRGRRGKLGCLVLKGQRSALFSFNVSPDL